MGEVPSDVETGASTPMVMGTGFTLAGNPYPTDMVLASTDLATAGQSGDALFYWEDQMWKHVGKIGSNWLPPGLTIPAGNAFFYKALASRSYDETKPYLWP